MGDTDTAKGHWVTDIVGSRKLLANAFLAVILCLLLVGIVVALLRALGYDVLGYFVPPAAVRAQLPVGTIVAWNPKAGETLSAEWLPCDGTNGTPDLRDRFIFGASSMSLAGQVQWGRQDGTPAHDHALAGQTTGVTASDDITFSGGQKNVSTNLNAEGHSHTHSLTGKTQPETWIPPCYRVIFIMKVK